MKKVKDLMIPLESYPSISENATLMEAILAFEEALRQRDRTRQPFRAVLVLDDRGNIVGKIGQLAFLKALEPKRAIMDDLSKISQVGVTREFLESVASNFELFGHDFSDLCYQARHRKVREVMHSLTEYIDREASLVEAVQKMVLWQTLSVLVKDGDNFVGLLRLSDLCQEVAQEMKRFTTEEQCD
jgi:CBS domain-containing protein